MLPLLAASAHAATPYLGLEWRPLSRGDLTWVEDGNTTGLSVGGLDGFARPQLSAYAGAWFSDHVAVHGSLGVARLTTTTWVEDTWTQQHWGVVRPAFDVRVALLERDGRRPVPWVFMGGHVDLPSARDVSNGYTPEEQQQADATATVDRIRLAAIGGRLGAGADLAVLEHLRLGLSWCVDWQRSLFLGDDPTAVTSWVAAEGALLAEFVWPQRPAPDADPAADTTGDP